jgi:hypothetical protein
VVAVRSASVLEDEVRGEHHEFDLDALRETK